MPARRRSVSVTVGAIALVTASLSGCSEADYDYAGVCVDQATGTRVADDQCDDDRSHGFYGGRGWYYVPRGGVAPAVGQQATGGTYKPPAGAWTGHGFSVKGGTVARGGFAGGHGSIGG